MPKGSSKLKVAYLYFTFIYLIQRHKLRVTQDLYPCIMYLVILSPFNDNFFWTIITLIFPQTICFNSASDLHFAEWESMNR